MVKYSNNEDDVDDDDNNDVVSTLCRVRLQFQALVYFFVIHLFIHFNTVCVCVCLAWTTVEHCRRSFRWSEQLHGDGNFHIYGKIFTWLWQRELQWLDNGQICRCVYGSETNSEIQNLNFLVTWPFTLACSEPFTINNNISRWSTIFFSHSIFSLSLFRLFISFVFILALLLTETQ